MAYLGESIPKLGFGLMRLPMAGDRVDLEQTKQMVDLFVEKGFTYFDTAYGYLGGQSEEAARIALVERYPREKFQLATKLPAWAGARDRADAENMFWTSLKRTGAGYFDFYLMHNLGNERTAYFEQYDIWNFLQKRKEEGLIRHLGFSFHDTADALEETLQKFPEAEFVQLQINYADWESSAIQSRRCYETARRHGKSVVVMEPVKGGALAQLPEPAAAIFREADPKASLASWAIRYAASLPGLVTVLSGMSTLDQVRDNVSFMEHFRPLSDAEQALVTRVQAALQQVPQIPCTACQYCVKGCPQGVEIPAIFKDMNVYLVYNNLTSARGSYGFDTRNGGKASDCVACGQCESVCPQHISIIEELKRAAEKLERNG